MIRETGVVQLTDRPQRAPAVTGRVVDGEAVLVHPRQGKIRVLNGVGARIWELADGERSVADLARAVATEYDVDLGRAESDAAAFCAELLNRGLLTLNRSEPQH